MPLLTLPALAVLARPLPGVLGAVAASWVAVVSPGPNLVLITHTSMSASRREALATAWGVTAGGAYLLYLGVRSWRTAATPLPEHPADPAQSPGSEPRPGPRPRAMFRRGMLTNLTNPKSAAFESPSCTSPLGRMLQRPEGAPVRGCSPVRVTATSRRTAAADGRVLAAVRAWRQ